MASFDSYSVGLACLSAGMFFIFLFHDVFVTAISGKVKSQIWGGYIGSKKNNEDVPVFFFPYYYYTSVFAWLGVILPQAAVAYRQLKDDDFFNDQFLWTYPFIVPAAIYASEISKLKAHMYTAKRASASVLHILEIEFANGVILLLLWGAWAVLVIQNKEVDSYALWCYIAFDPAAGSLLINYSVALSKETDISTKLLYVLFILGKMFRLLGFCFLAMILAQDVESTRSC